MKAHDRYYDALAAGYDEHRAARRARRLAERCIEIRCPGT
jgi:hypothetical protein